MLDVLAKAPFISTMAAGVCKQLGEKYLDLARSFIHYASNDAIKTVFYSCIVKPDTIIPIPFAAASIGRCVVSRPNKRA